MEQIDLACKIHSTNRGRAPDLLQSLSMVSTGICPRCGVKIKYLFNKVLFESSGAAVTQWQSSHIIYLQVFRFFLWFIWVISLQSHTVWHFWHYILIPDQRQCKCLFYALDFLGSNCLNNLQRGLTGKLSMLKVFY